MVRRLLSAVALVAVAGALTPPGADAANHKIAIGDFRWSTPTVHVDLGEHVTWFWAGPDLQHSVTGGSANDTSTDSDPGRDVPEHRVGDRFQVSFSQAGTYEFHCKLHPGVAGQVIVDPLPGDATAEPDPDPVLRPDRSAPSLQDLRLRTARRGAVRLRYSLDQAATVLAELRSGSRLVRSQVFGGHVGYGSVALNVRGLRAGRYTMRLSASDAAGNTAPWVVRTLRLSTSSRR